MRDTCFATAFYHVCGRSPNFWTWSQRNRIEAYYRCIVVFFASVRRFYREERLILFSNQALPDGFDRLLRHFGVETVLLPSERCRYAEDRDLRSAFPGCLFTLDVIDHLAVHPLQEEPHAVFLYDSDCLFTKPLDDAEMRCAQEGLSGIKLSYPPAQSVNGQSVESLSRLYHEVTGVAAPLSIDYFGGEFYAISSTLLEEVAAQIRLFFDALKASRDRYGAACTEEHIMSLVYAVLTARVTAANSVRRIWTADNYNNIDGSESHYPVYHLPAEKGAFFRDTFHLLSADRGLLREMSSSDYLDFVSQPLQGCLHPSMSRSLKRALKNCIRKVLA